MSKSEQFEGVDAKELANAIRALAMDAVEQAKSGHPGMPMGMADAATVLFAKFLKFDPSNPSWPDRDHGGSLIIDWESLTARFHEFGKKGKRNVVGKRANMTMKNASYREEPQHAV